MPPNFRYRLLLTAEAFQFYDALRSAKRRALKSAFQFFADHPFSEGEYQEVDRDGRTTEVLLRGQFLFAFWADHSAKEIRILRVDWA